MDGEQLRAVRAFVGPVTEDQIRNVQSFIGGDCAVFIPVGGPCYYSLSEEHTHPAYSFYIPHSAGMGINVCGAVHDSVIGRLYAFHPDLVHHEIMAVDVNRFTALMVARDRFEREAAQYGFTLSDRQHMDIPTPEPLSALVRDFMSECASALPGRDEVIAALETRLLHELLRSLSGTSRDSGRVSQRMDIDRAIEYIEAHCDGEVSVAKAARVANLSVAHFSRVFSRETGMSPQEFISVSRLNRARVELVRGEKSVTEIALLCGFAGSAAFSTAFSRKYGCPPSEYRAAMRGR